MDHGKGSGEAGAGEQASPQGYEPGNPGVDEIGEPEKARTSSQGLESGTPGVDEIGEPEKARKSKALIGVEIGPYRTVEKLGEGGMGVVFKAVDRALEREVALKILFEVDDEQNVRRFQQEARALAKVTHPNAIQVFWIGEYKGYPCFAMEYIAEGVSVYDLLRHKGVLPLDDSIDIIIQAARGLNAARRAGIVHRDIKPNNLLIDIDGTVKISDFGLAKIVEGGDGHLTQSGIVMGTPYYMSPEQGQGEAIDHRSDLYSLGATFYHMITGFTPYEAQNPVSLIIKHVKDPIPDIRQVNPSVPDDIRRIVETCLEKDPLDRYQEYDELIEDLESFREGQGLVNAASVRARRRGSRMPSWLYFASGLVLAGALAGATRMITSGPSSDVSPRTDPTEVAMLATPDVTAAPSPVPSAEPGELDRARAEMASSVPTFRARAAVTFGKLAAADAVPDLLPLALEDPDPGVRARAVWALGRIGDARAVTSVIEALGDGDPFVVRQAISALAGRPDVRMVEPLKGLAARHADPDVRRAAARAVDQVFLEDPDLVFGGKPGTWWRRQFRDGEDHAASLRERAAEAERSVRYYRQRYGFSPGDKAPPAGADLEARDAFRITYGAAIALLDETRRALRSADAELKTLIAAADDAEVPPDWRR